MQSVRVYETATETAVRHVQVTTGRVALDGELAVPAQAEGIVLFAHGSGSSRFSPRNRFVARLLNEAGLATLLFDLLTPLEEEMERTSRHLRFDIELLANRLVGATDWIGKQPETHHPGIGYFGASTGAAAALSAAAQRPDVVQAVVSRGGRPDLALPVLARVRAPTLLIVGGNDIPVIAMNQEAQRKLRNAPAQLEIVPNASHLFAESGALAAVAQLARDWFQRYLCAKSHVARSNGYSTTGRISSANGHPRHGAGQRRRTDEAR